MRCRCEAYGQSNQVPHIETDTEDNANKKLSISPGSYIYKYMFLILLRHIQIKNANRVTLIVYFDLNVKVYDVIFSVLLCRIMQISWKQWTRDQNIV